MSGLSGWGTGRAIAAAAAIILAAACTEGTILLPPEGGEPAPPRALEGSYYNRAVFLSWELGPGWNNESFRVYGKRVSDANYFLIAEVTSCAGGVCNYTDRNINPNVTYRYYVAAFDARSGLETASEYAVDVQVPNPVPPPVPGGVEAVALDGGVFIRWNDAARGAGDFSFYRLYVQGPEQDFILGETDSEGFLDLLVQNGLTYTYSVSSVDDQGHESQRSGGASATPRPDYTGEWIYAWEDQPASSGFRFMESDAENPIVSGTASNRHFRLEVDVDGWWLVPGPGAQIYPTGFATTQLRCGPGADAGCVELDRAPASGYVTHDVGLFPQTSYVIRYPSGGGFRYGTIRVSMQAFDQDGNALMIFDWAHQLQVGNLNLAPVEAPFR